MMTVNKIKKKYTAKAPSVLIGKNLENLKQLIWRWIHGNIKDFDIWDITIETHEVVILK